MESNAPIGNARKKGIRRSRNRATPPPQDKLVIVFIFASSIFAFISISPFLFGHFPHHNSAGLFRIHNSTSLTHLQLQNGVELDIDGSSAAEDSDLPLARGSSGLPMSSTPALNGAKHGSISCQSDFGDFKLDKIAYWNEPGPYDTEFVSPFAPKDTQLSRRYITFEPDKGGWNNIRMSMEIIFVFAAVTGRTLVLPPDTPFYLLKETKGKGSKHHGFADFVDIGKLQGVDMVTMKEFLELESKNGGLVTLPTGIRGEKIRNSAEYCYYVAKSDRPCDAIYEFLKDKAYIPELQAGRDCLIFDLPSKMRKKESLLDSEVLEALPTDNQQEINRFCDGRNPIFFGGELDTAPWIHFHSGDKFHRLLNHFYTFLYFTDSKVGNHYKRFVRDCLHYTDTIYCAAGKVISMLEKEGYSAMHIRRGDFQYKQTKISAEEWLNATIGILQPRETVYIATDEKDRSFFEPLKREYNLRFLDDFSEAAGLNDLDPNYAGELVILRCHALMHHSL